MIKGLFFSALALVGFPGLVLGYDLYNSEYSAAAIAGKQNVQNLLQVEPGMDSLTVSGLMGNPAEKYTHQGHTFYHYPAPPGASFQCQVVFDQKGKVIYTSGVPEDN
ncbi:hypothetical protein [Rufibacter psychrotolerans]|uniref:hypothetical protein n=1 Tax=Rufibacter psychrotolerans TaxID=2812556 RepID=UPI001967481F|nr:hypothetical protein [Rufibacter sp. SYSU D00308]